MTPEDVKSLQTSVFVKSTGIYEDEGRTKKLPIEQRYSFRNLNLNQIF